MIRERSMKTEGGKNYGGVRSARSYSTHAPLGCDSQR
jgi:hypothetical protein